MSDAGSRFARHVMLAEIGARGQETLLAARYRVSASTDARVADVIHAYLGRAGMAPSEEGREVAVPADVATLARDPRLESAAAFLLGALAAVEHVKSELGIGAPLMGALPELTP